MIIDLKVKKKIKIYIIKVDLFGSHHQWIKKFEPLNNNLRYFREF